MNNLKLPSLPDMANIWQETLQWTPTVQQQVQFQQLYEFILQGNNQFNLTRITDPQEFWEKHLWDSLRGIAPILRDGGVGAAEGENTSLSSPTSSTPLSVIDIGTGAGFPGFPVAIAVANSTVTLLDSTRKKIAFLEETRAALDFTNVKTFTGRAEEVGQQPQHRQNYDVALVRAVGTASVCAEYALPLLKQGGLAVIYRGNWTEEETKVLENAVDQLGGVIELVDKFTTPLSESIRHCLYLRKVRTTPVHFPRPVGVPTQKPL
ncbi:16S rRNA (guanine(527)-N(7))-methyltransferase RsmG [Brasilonema octagenarum UFV-E1]|uniref:Ribosomal RNA small subunit methyltransferase G n=2 Tax=Brasilonema TaxID=383614 RepID=A0A856MLG1_9CYAN|nr:16S rRNA (guanine(527)-N(7))-methyltransferase RsmG [Brasilonema sennae]NMF66516.1 16S rRNA (guanine(527)-N(7))-methyltransferase RsmG [Brasilonema octagenarum UFV-OR1]QDL11209.1 16S rRNA (guanine(527)-N(7))-methyltransferase RsmG [Brasilonema sennae CENA114]QDL17554.1 16S rRNA (guanine(527)-N(7))-methyltransferase RsmG [Brasilonema octagenarum UFV-E1]